MADFNRHVYKSARWQHSIADRSNSSSYWYFPRTLADGRQVPPLMCERCFELYGVLEPAEIIHHRNHLTPENVNDPEVCYDFDNLQRVCRRCHGVLHSSEQSPHRIVEFDEMGNPIRTIDPIV